MPDENVIQPTQPAESVQTPASAPSFIDEVPAPENNQIVTEIVEQDPVQTSAGEPTVVPAIEPFPANAEPQIIERVVYKTAEPEIVEKIIYKTAEPQVIEKIVFKEDPNIIKRLLSKAQAKIQERKRKKLDRIMALFNTHLQISNKDVKKMLRIAESTATRYLDQLEKEQKITQTGKVGQSVSYVKRQ